MNEQGNKALGIDGQAFAESVKSHAATIGTVDLRSRTPAEMAQQLHRNATSLELTGSHLEKDQGFYQAVAADLREAAGFLANWQTVVDDLHRRAETAAQRAKLAALRYCAEVAHGVADLQPIPLRGPGHAWRNAGKAIAQAIEAREASDDRPEHPPVTDRQAAGQELRK